MVIQRIGQDVFRDALMDYWGGRTQSICCFNNFQTILREL